MEVRDNDLYDSSGVRICSVEEFVLCCLLFDLGVKVFRKFKYKSKEVEVCEEN